MTEKQQIILPPEDGGADAAPHEIEKPDLEAAMNGIHHLMEIIPTQVERCENCKFYLDTMSIAMRGKQGFCRRNPPTLVFLGMQPSGVIGKPPLPVTQSYWPFIAVDGWCGEFTRKLVQ